LLYYHPHQYPAAAAAAAAPERPPPFPPLSPHHPMVRPVYGPRPPTVPLPYDHHHQSAHGGAIASAAGGV
jgi:hypothetical protein